MLVWLENFLQSVREQRVPKHVSIRGFKKLDVVLETAVRRVGLLQSLLHALQLTLVAAFHLEEHRNAHKNQLCFNLLLKCVNLQSTPKSKNISFFLEPVHSATLGLFTGDKVNFLLINTTKILITWEHRSTGVLVLQNCPTQRGTIVILST